MYSEATMAELSIPERMALTEVADYMMTLLLPEAVDDHDAPV